MLWGLIGVLHTFKLHFIVPTFLSTTSDINDLLVLTFGNCVY